MVDNTYFHYWELIFLLTNLLKWIDQQKTANVTTTPVDVVKSALLTHMVTSLPEPGGECFRDI